MYLYFLYPKIKFNILLSINLSISIFLSISQVGSYQSQNFVIILFENLPLHHDTFLCQQLFYVIMIQYTNILFYLASPFLDIQLDSSKLISLGSISQKLFLLLRRRCEPLSLQRHVGTNEKINIKEKNDEWGYRCCRQPQRGQI